MPRTALVLFLFAALGCPRRVPEGAKMTDAAVYVAKSVRTLDRSRPLAQALAVRGGKVVAVGTREEALAAAGPDAELVELDGFLVPGLADAHVHLASLGRSLSTVSFVGTRSPEEVVERARQAGPDSHQGDWLVGRGWDQNDWPEGKRVFPGRALLDAAFPNTPVMLSRVDGHAVWVNGAALSLAGVTAKTPDPAGGRIVRDAAGEPTGVLVDNAIALVDALVSPPTEQQFQRRLKAAIERCLAEGLTQVHDAGMDLRTFSLLQQWDAIGALPLRVYAMADGQGPDAQLFLERGLFQGQKLTMRAVKFLADGALGSRGAALEAPYSDDPTQSGLLLLSADDLELRARAFDEAGFQVAVHAIGDRANRIAIDVLSRLEARHPGSRPRVEHAQLLGLEELNKLATGRLVVSMQPTHATSDMGWVEARVGPRRLLGAYAWKSVLQVGAPLAFGSDFPVEDPSPLLGLYAARTRQDADGKPAQGWRPGERVTGEEALRAFTTGAAYAAFAEDARGRLSPGMDADFTVLSVDPVEAPAKELLTAKVLLTVVGGRPVYQR
jgi:predicted amidohydrolase YtcJ